MSDYEPDHFEPGGKISFNWRGGTFIDQELKLIEDNGKEYLATENYVAIVVKKDGRWNWFGHKGFDLVVIDYEKPKRILELEIGGYSISLPEPEPTYLPVLMMDVWVFDTHYCKFELSRSNGDDWVRLVARNKKDGKAVFIAFESQAHVDLVATALMIIPRKLAEKEARALAKLENADG